MKSNDKAVSDCFLGLSSHFLEMINNFTGKVHKFNTMLIRNHLRLKFSIYFS